MNKEKLAMGGAFGAAALVASCCLAPTLLIVFGVSAGGLAQLSALEPYRPIFIAVGALFLTYAAWRIYRPAARELEQTECADESCSPASQQRRFMQTVFWFGVASFVGAIIYPYALEAYLMSCG